MAGGRAEAVAGRPGAVTSGRVGDAGCASSGSDAALSDGLAGLGAAGEGWMIPKRPLFPIDRELKGA